MLQLSPRLPGPVSCSRDPESWASKPAMQLPQRRPGAARPPGSSKTVRGREVAGLVNLAGQHVIRSRGERKFCSKARYVTGAAPDFHLKHKHRPAVAEILIVGET